MKIRKQQMSEFSTQKIESFVLRMSDHLQNHFQKELDKWKISNEDVKTFVRQGVDLAETYGVVVENDVKLFLEAQMLFGPKFHEDKNLPWARKILTNNKLDGRQKMDRIHSHMIFSKQEN